MQCIKRGKECYRCLELFTDVGLNLHLSESKCGLRKYDVEDLRTWATEVNDKRMSVLIKDYHTKIVAAAMHGNFKIRLDFNYLDDNQVTPADALSKLIYELKKLFTNVEITPDHLGSFIDVAWTIPKPWPHITLQELEVYNFKERMSKRVSDLSRSLPKTSKKTVFINELFSESPGDNSKVPVSDEKQMQGQGGQGQGGQGQGEQEKD